MCSGGNYIDQPRPHGYGSCGSKRKQQPIIVVAPPQGQNQPQPFPMPQHQPQHQQPIIIQAPQSFAPQPHQQQPIFIQMPSQPQSFGGYHQQPAYYHQHSYGPPHVHYH